MLSKPADLLSLSHKYLFWFALLLSVLPIWVVKYPPMVDLPQHAAQVNALHQMWHNNPLFTSLFEINWFTPYLAGYLAVYFFTLFLPLMIAFKVVISISVIATPLLSGMLFREIGADERWKWLVIPSSLSFAFYWGLLNYLVAIPLGLLFLIFTIRFNHSASLKNGILIGAYSIFLFLSHVLVLAFASLLSLSYLIGANYRNFRAVCLRSLPYTTPLPLIAFWLLATYAGEHQASESSVVLNYNIKKLHILLTQFTGSDLPFFVYIVFATVIAFPFLVRAKLNRRPERWLPLATGVIVYLAAPSHAFGADLIDQRLGAFLAPLWFTIWDAPEKKSAIWDWIVVCIVCIWISMNMYRFVQFDRDAKQFDEIMSLIQPAKKVMSLMAVNRSPHFSYPVFLHFPSWYQASNNGIVDFNFGQFYPVMVRYKKSHMPKVGELNVWYPTLFRWHSYDGASYDYFIVRAQSDMSREIFKERRSAVRLISRAGRWWLYENRLR